jgi:hypothetical protein
MAAGGAAAFSYTRRSIMNSIAGVAIAVALVPPLAVSGIGLALRGSATVEAGLSLTKFGEFSGGVNISFGAFLLFLTNLFGIITVAILIFVFQRYGKWKKALFGLVLFVGLSMLLFQPLNKALHRLYVKNRVVRLLAELAHDRPDIVTGRAKFESISVTYRDDLLRVNVECFSPKDELIDQPDMPLQKRIDLFSAYLSEDIGEPVVAEFDLILVDMIHLKSQPPEGSSG